MEGLVYKQKMFKRWTEHYMLSDRRMLYYFNSNKPEVPYMDHAAICLDLTKLTGLETDLTKKNIIILRHPVKNIRFKAESAKAYEAWLSYFAVFYEHIPETRSHISIPSIHFKALWHLLHWVKMEGAHYEGIFRKSAVKAQVTQLVTTILLEGEVDLRHHEIVVIAQSCKTILDRLPDSLFTENILGTLADRPTLAQVKELLRDQFPEQNLQLIKLLLLTCLKLSSNESTTRMNPSNLSILFAPVLSSRHIDIIEALDSYKELSWFFQLCIENYWEIFGTDPPKYNAPVSTIHEVLSNREMSTRQRYLQFNRFFSFTFLKKSQGTVKKSSTIHFDSPKASHQVEQKFRKSITCPSNTIENSLPYWHRTEEYRSGADFKSSVSNSIDEKKEDRDLTESEVSSHQVVDRAEKAQYASAFINVQYPPSISRNKNRSSSGLELPEEPVQWRRTKSLNSLKIHRINPRRRSAGRLELKIPQLKEEEDKLPITRIKNRTDSAAFTTTRCSLNVLSCGSRQSYIDHSPSSILETEGQQNDISWCTQSDSLQHHPLESIAATGIARNKQKELSDNPDVHTISVFSGKTQLFADNSEMSVLKLNFITPRESSIRLPSTP